MLEIGTGLGFQTAILARLCHEIVSIDWYADLAAQACENLKAAGTRNVSAMVGDGSAGLAQRAPYDGILVGAAVPHVSDALVGQMIQAARLGPALGTAATSA